jgi:hypothetical protein
MQVRTVDVNGGMCIPYSIIYYTYIGGLPARFPLVPRQATLLGQPRQCCRHVHIDITNVQTQFQSHSMSTETKYVQLLQSLSCWQPLRVPATRVQSVAIAGSRVQWVAVGHSR